MPRVHSDAHYLAVTAKYTFKERHYRVVQAYKGARVLLGKL